MLAFPNIKINLGLSITEKRPDGYHNLETVFYPVALEDALEIRTSSETEKKIILHQYGMEIAGNPEDNLVVKAYLLMDKEFHLPSCRNPLIQAHPFRSRTGRRFIGCRFHAKVAQRSLSAGSIRRTIGSIRCHFGSRLRFLYQKQTDICRGNWKHLLPGRTFIKRLPNHDYKTECFCFHPGSLFKHSSPSSEISG